MAEQLNGVFLVDDDRSINLYNRWILEGMEVFREIVEFRGGQEALDAVNERLADPSRFPNLILLDVNMPGMDGLQFAKEYRSIDPNGERAVIALLLTSPLLPEQEAKAQDLGINHFIEKPLEEEQIAKLLGQLPKN